MGGQLKRQVAVSHVTKVNSMQEIARFSATDSEGKAYTLIAYQEYAPSRRGDPQIPSITSVRTSTGDHVNRLSRGRYELLSYGRVLLTSDDPNAI
jgi:hypothetical protein